ncbi:hypothetical protein AAW14_33185 [Streptomyces hygroscopicus]|uniref:hypothetical protein n=1 Tax=Streptomyces hygroscopicus TaxID=1912 RepID=UPI00223FC0FA|nr:hypothetical protein [Streptomyces hygroscopicus]MCW7946706.1 hypothetical protein [Streptomyces hygroscopicus]
MSTDSGPNAGDEEEAQADLCDLCGTLVLDGTQWNALVRDSSAIHAIDPKYDGKRLVVSCSREHLAAVVEQYERRPFLYAELWAGKITRVLRQHPNGISPEDLARETGLNSDEIKHALTWRNIEVQRWQQQRGQYWTGEPKGGQ